MVSTLKNGGAGQHVNFFIRVHQTNMTYQQLLAIWQVADRLGYDGASLYDLLAAPCLESWTALSALTTACQHLRAIPMVLAYPYRHPAVLAKMAATLDVISGGRLVLGLGAGGSQRLEDGVNLIRFLWSGQAGQYNSRYHGKVVGPAYPLPIQRPGPPILIGGHGEQYLLRTVARVAELCNIGFDLSAVQWERYQQMLSQYAAEEGLEAAAVDLTHNATVILSHDPAVIRSGIEHYAYSRGCSIRDAWLRLEHALVGTPEQCVARLQAYVALGIRHFFLLFPDLPDVTSLELFAHTVLPVFRTS